MKIIRHRERIDSKRRFLSFERADGSGYWFPLGADDRPLLDADNRANYESCVSDKGLGPGRIREVDTSYNQPAVGLCDRCGAEVVLAGFTNTCDCGADYNHAGQMLAPRGCWGEETGETAADILRGGEDDGLF